MKFSIGDKVVEKTSLRAHTNYSVSQVVGFLNEAVLITGWGDGFDGELHEYDFLTDKKPGSRSWREGITRVQESELCTPDEALEALKVLEGAKSKLEEEFGNLRDSVREKLDQAAVLVKEAGALIKPLDKSFYNLTQECKELYLALDTGGWSHSTMTCKYGR